MTENKAIIEEANEIAKGRMYATKALIECQKELEQYRAIGTVEQLKWCKDASHWKELFKEKLEQYEAIGTIEEFNELKEKSVAKKPMPIDYEKYIGVIENAKFLRGAYWCPNCKHTVRSGAYCDDCGQKLDWQ